MPNPVKSQSQPAPSIFLSFLRLALCPEVTITTSKIHITYWGPNYARFHRCKSAGMLLHAEWSELFKLRSLSERGCAKSPAPRNCRLRTGNFPN